MVTSPIEWKILEWDEKPQTNKFYEDFLNATFIVTKYPTQSCRLFLTSNSSNLPGCFQESWKIEKHQLQIKQTVLVYKDKHTEMNVSSKYIWGGKCNVIMRRSCRRLGCSPRMQKVRCSNASSNKPNSSKQVVAGPLCVTFISHFFYIFKFEFRQPCVKRWKRGAIYEGMGGLCYNTGFPRDSEAIQRPSTIEGKLSCNNENNFTISVNQGRDKFQVFKLLNANLHFWLPQYFICKKLQENNIVF